VVLKSVGMTRGFSIEWFEFSHYEIKILFLWIMLIWIYGAIHRLLL